MKLTELKQLIREETKRILSEKKNLKEAFQKRETLERDKDFRFNINLVVSGKYDLSRQIYDKGETHVLEIDYDRKKLESQIAEELKKNFKSKLEPMYKELVKSIFDETGSWASISFNNSFRDKY